MALAETIVSINKNSFTPFSLGLVLQMHHVYGSKNLVETLHSHVFYASYNELRRYLTSLADHMITCASSRRIGSMRSLGLSYDKQLIRANVFSVSGRERS
jgi:hypothetical protein